MSSAFEQELKRQMDAKQQQRLIDRMQDGQFNPPHYGAPFAGDMNRAVPDIDYQLKPLLHDDKFLQQDLSQMGDRERRIYLRDKERERRNQLPPAGINALPVMPEQFYGGIPATSPAAPEAQSKRDLMLALKLQQRQQQLLPMPTLQNYNQVEPQAQPSSQFDPRPPTPFTPQKYDLIRQEPDLSHQPIQPSANQHPAQPQGLPLGQYQYQQQQDKLQKQQQYAQDLQSQFRKEPVSSKKQIAEQVMNEVLESQRSAVGANRMLELQRLQMQQTKDMFYQDEDSNKRKQQEQKRQYALMLQQQIDSKKQSVSKYAQQDLLPQSQPQPQQVRRGQTDITRRGGQEDDQKVQARLKYQEELRQQVEQQRQRKELMALQMKREEEMEEQRLQKERQQLQMGQRREQISEGVMVKEEAKTRQVNRQQFEQSLENGGRQTVHSIQINMPPTISSQQYVSGDGSDYLHNEHSQQHQEFQPAKHSDYVTVQQQARGQEHEPRHIEQPAQLQEYQLMDARKPPVHQNYFTQPPQYMPPQYPPYMLPQYVLPPQAYPQPSPQPPAQEPQWQQQQSNKMFEDQQKMIQLYQQALEQILQYRNQYFEQAMEMRENILKEREQMLEFEKLKQQQMLEMQQLQAVKNELRNVQYKREILQPHIQSNLENYIQDQSQQILSMSQSNMQLHSQSEESLEMSLNGQSKMVKVNSQQDQLLTTWNEVSINKQMKQTESSFYNHTVKQQKIKQETQEIEMKQQMLRIFGQTTVAQPDLEATPSLRVVSESGRDEPMEDSMGSAPPHELQSIRSSVQRQSNQSVKPFTKSFHDVKQSVDLKMQQQSARDSLQQFEFKQRSSLQSAIQTIDVEKSYNSSVVPESYPEQSKVESDDYGQAKQQDYAYQAKQQDDAYSAKQSDDYGSAKQSDDAYPAKQPDDAYQTKQSDDNYQAKQEDDAYSAKQSQEQSIIKSELPSEINIANTQPDGFMLQYMGLDQLKQETQQLFSQIQQAHYEYLADDVHDSGQHMHRSEWSGTNNTIPLVIQQDPQFMMSGGQYEVFANSTVEGLNNMSPEIYKTQESLEEPQILSEKDLQMLEIAALIRKAQQTTNDAVVKAQQREPKRNILDDLDKIINDLEQQKNMHTFGDKNAYQLPDDHSDDRAGDEPDAEEQRCQQDAEPVKKWKTLTEARMDRPTTSKSKSVGKAPLAPRTAESCKSRRDETPPTNVMGKFSNMALNQNNSDKSQDRSVTSRSPQRVGKYSQMALNVSKQDKSVSSRSPQRVGQFAQMALDSSRISNKQSNVGSPQMKVGKFATLAVQSNSQIEDNYPSESRKQSPTPSLLRPVSGSFSSRYQRPQTTIEQQRPGQVAYQTSTPGVFTTLTAKHKEHFYLQDSDEEDDSVRSFSMQHQI